MDLSQTEKIFMKRAMPFSTFSRKNIPLQVMELTKRPRHITTIAHIRTAINGAAKEQEDENVALLNQYAKDGFLVKNVFHSGKNSKYTDIGDHIPSVMAVRALSSPRQFYNFLMGQLHPAIKAPLTIGSNFNYMTQRPIVPKKLIETASLLKGRDKATYRALQRQIDSKKIEYALGSTFRLFKAIKKRVTKTAPTMWARAFYSEKTILELAAMSVFGLHSTEFVDGLGKRSGVLSLKGTIKELSREMVYFQDQADQAAINGDKELQESNMLAHDLLYELINQVSTGAGAIIGGELNAGSNLIKQRDAIETERNNIEVQKQEARNAEWENQ